MAPVASGLAVVTAIIFAAAALTKLQSLSRFRDELSDYELLPTWLIGPSAAVIPLLELGSAAIAIYPPTRLIGSAALLALLLLFSVAIGVNLRRGRTDVRCACFGENSQTLDWVLLLRNGLLGLSLLSALIVPASTTELLTVAGALAAVTGLALGWLVIEAARGVEITKAEGIKL